MAAPLPKNAPRKFVTSIQGRKILSAERPVIPTTYPVMDVSAVLSMPLTRNSMAMASIMDLNLIIPNSFFFMSYFTCFLQWDIAVTLTGHRNLLIPESIN